MKTTMQQVLDALEFISHGPDVEDCKRVAKACLAALAATEPDTEQSAPVLPKWIDDEKGKDPLIDNLIAYIERHHAPIQSADQVRDADVRNAALKEAADLMLGYGPSGLLNRFANDILNLRSSPAPAATAAPSDADKSGGRG